MPTTPEHTPAGPVELLASYWTIAGDVYPGGPTEVSPWPFRDRIAAAAAAGFTGVGLVHADLVAVEAAIGLDEMRRILEGHGVRHVEVEFLQHWWDDGPRGRAAAAVRRDLMRMAEALGARDIKIAPEYGVEGIDLPRHCEAFADLCREAAEHGTAIALEVMPFSNVATLEVARAIVEGAGALNGGLLLDLWHVVRGGIGYDEVAALPAGTIASVELDDAAAEPIGSLWDDTIFHRRRCGEGAFDVRGFIDAVRAAGYTGPYGLEIIGTDHRLLPLGEAAQRAYETTMAQFEQPR